jgi:hypothetical protein
MSRSHEIWLVRGLGLGIGIAVVQSWNVKKGALQQGWNFGITAGEGGELVLPDQKGVSVFSKSVQNRQGREGVFTIWYFGNSKLCLLKAIAVNNIKYSERLKRVCNSGFLYHFL